MQDFKIKDLGVMDYDSCYKLQLDLCAQRQEDLIPNTVLIVEHPAVITLGVRQEKNLLLEDQGDIEEQGIPVVPLRRGGGATAHNVGQLVFYPIVNLKSIGMDITSYIRCLEEIGIELFESFGIDVGRNKGFPGLWVMPKKIASIGVKVKRWVTFHGMAINVNNDLEIFKKIVPCGLDGVSMTSLANEYKKAGKQVSADIMKQARIKLAGIIKSKLFNV